MAVRILSGLVAAVLLVAACGLADPGSVTPSDEPVEPAVELPDADVLAAIEFRESMGLRADEAWVRTVAANPDAVHEFEVPLLAFERDELLSRPGSSDAVVEAVTAYGAEHPDVFGGLYLDQASGGIVTALFTEDPPLHEAAIRKGLAPDTQLVVRQVRWSEAELRELQDRMTDEAFLETLPARMTYASVDISDNIAELGISSAVPDAEARIIEHFDAAGKLRVVSDGTGVLLHPVGRIQGRIIAPPGTDFGAFSPQYEADIDIGPRDSIGIQVEPDGTFVLGGLPPATYTVTILHDDGSGPEAIGTAVVAVPPGGVVPLEIVLDRP